MDAFMAERLHAEFPSGYALFKQDAAAPCP
jgi:hypothetical protein